MLIVFTALIELAAPFFVATIIAPGFADDPAKFDLTVLLARIMFPYLACMSLVAMASGVLNALHRYFAAAFAPVLLNIILIAVLGAAIASGLPAEAIGHLMAWGVFTAGLAQLLFLAVAVRKAGFPLTLARPRMTPAVRRLLVLAGPAALAGGITQINLFIGQIIASQKAGAIAVLQFADRVYQLPLGVVGIAIGVVLLPELSRALKGGDREKSANLQNHSLEFALFLTLPAAAALFVIPEPVVRVLFERGAFLPETTAIVSAALAWFALGLPAFVLIKVFLPGFFAREDTKTPMYVAGVAVVLNVALSLTLFPVMGEAGIALATTLAGWVNAALLFGLLMRRGHWPVEASSMKRGGLLCVASLIMAVALWGGLGVAGAALRPDSALVVQAGALGLLVAGGAALYFVLAQLLGAADLKALAAMARQRGGKTLPDKGE
ncbi:MAG: murein biosynthesis integral membrane protein MurJ [Alphaproteobacteria bacterium]|nr:MAG: murein biosynthesis integral membrane protein MurJ [Alphaproteobacteria bacterium]